MSDTCVRIAYRQERLPVKGRYFLASGHVYRMRSCTILGKKSIARQRKELRMRSHPSIADAAQVAHRPALLQSLQLLLSFFVSNDGGRMRVRLYRSFASILYLYVNRMLRNFRNLAVVY